MQGCTSLRGVASAVTLWALLVSSAAAQVDVDPMASIGLDDAAIKKEIDDPNSYYTQLHPCPLACESKDPSSWVIYNSFDRLARCAEPMLLDFAIHNPIADPNTPTKISVCTEGGDPNTRVNALFDKTEASSADASSKRVRRRRDAPAAECGVSEVKDATASLDFTSEGLGPGDDESVTAILNRLQDFFQDEASCNSKFLFGYYQGVVAGVYSGRSIGRQTVSSVIQNFVDDAASGTTTLAQLCGSGRNANHAFGVVVSRNITVVQETVKTWASGACVGVLETQRTISDVGIWESTADLAITANSTIATNLTRRVAAHQDLGHEHGHLIPRADCRTVNVIGGDGCAALASRCGITAAQFTEYNSAKDLCSTLVPGQRVCCSAGTLPDITPKPNADGTCFPYFVDSGDTCSEIAVSHGLTVAQLEKFNNGTTWGWYGCGKLLAKMNICLSTGKPPMPYPVANAICGPTKPNSTQPTDDTELKDMNPCPLNVCCNVWGQCGISSDFCEYKPGPSPGTSELQNGCVSSCGQEIINDDTPPASFGRIGYYETWNYNRKCLHLSAYHANTDLTYTHIHWAFAAINTKDWTVSINDTYKQWSYFKALPEKRIISFGGWGYSTEPATYDILRQAMSPENRVIFAQNVAKFIQDEGLDGVDFDWEYPGATDIDGTPAGNEQDGPNYLKFLVTMKRYIASGKTVSIAAPASYWYLRNFPIATMSTVIDYIVYMTYDLHGQWDAGSQFSIGCPAGNCARSHVNGTEQLLTLSMITKAGVPTNKIFVGESSYGRSFKLAQAGCKGPNCIFTGDRLNSNAAKGFCTDTAGYISNAEIEDIIKSGDHKVDAYYDNDSASDMLIYDDTEWVSYMSPLTKSARRILWQIKNFAGTIDWAVDLQAFSDDEGSDPLDDTPYEDTLEDWPALAACTGSYATLEDLERAGDSVPDHCKSRYIIEIMKGINEQSMKDYDTLISGGYDRKFNTYADAVVKSGQATINTFMHDHGNEYFTCTVTEEVMACDHCHATYSPDEGQCRYCEDYDDGWDSVCDQPEVLCGPFESRYKNITGPCSPDFSLRAGPEPTGGYGSAVFWSMKSGKKDEFWAALYSNSGIKEEDVKWVTHERSECFYNQEDCDKWWKDYNYPEVEGYTKEDVINPKDVVSKSYGQLKELAPDMSSVLEMVQNDAFNGDDADIVDASAIPIFMVKDAVKQMTDIDDTVDKWDEEKRKNIILAFLTAVFFFIPIIGEVIGTVASLANIGRIIAVLGTLGELATDIYSIVDNKDNIALALFSIILTPLGIMDAVQIGKAAARRASMKPEELKSLGDNVRLPVEKIETIKGKSCKLPATLAVRMFQPPMSSPFGEQMWQS